MDATSVGFAQEADAWALLGIGLPSTIPAASGTHHWYLQFALSMDGSLTEYPV